MIKVMLVDDEPIFLRGFKNLIKWEEIDCAITQVAMNGEEALENLARDKPDIIITDLIMPGMDGIELIKQVKSLEPSIEIIILSGHGEFEFAQQALENEVCGYLLKPVTRQQMSDEVCKAVARIKKTDPSRLSLNCFRCSLRKASRF
jgi:two-component system, response regulator YesN